MAILFPTDLDNFTNPTPANNLNTPAVLHSDQHSNLNDAVEALEVKVGVDGSLITGSFDFRINYLESVVHVPVTLGVANGLALVGQQLSLGIASGTSAGALSASDWTLFSSKQNALTFPLAANIGGSGISNSGTFTNHSNTVISGGGSLLLGGYTLTVPATGTAALLATANVFTATQTVQTTNGDTVLDAKFSRDWATLASATPDLDDGGWGSYTLRQVINSAQITASSGSQKVRVSIETGAAVIGAVYIGLAAVSGDAYDFDTTPVQVTFDSGSSGYTTAGGTKLSDAVDFVYSSGRNLVVAIYASGATNYRSKDTQTGWQAYYKSGSDASTVNATGYASWKAVTGAKKVEAGTPDLTSVLKVNAGVVQLPTSNASYILATNSSKEVYGFTPTSNIGLLNLSQTWTGGNTFNGVNLRRSSLFGVNTYNALTLGDVTSGETTGAGMFVARENPAKVPFTAFMGFDGDGDSRILYFGGGGWGTPDATFVRFYTAPSYSETANTGLLRLEIPTVGATTSLNHTTTNNAVLDIFSILARVSTAATGGANGFGTGLAFYAETATDGTDQKQGQISTSWVDSTNASRKAKMSISAYDTAARLGIEIEADGSAAKLGFYGVTPIARAVLATGAGATVDNVITALQNLGLVKQS